MKTSGKLLIVSGIVAAFVVGLAVGVSFSTLLVGAVLLACPAMMLFGMDDAFRNARNAAGGCCPGCDKHAHTRN